MAYGKGTQYDKSDNVIFFSPRGVDKEKKKCPPYFELAKIVDDKIQKLDETATELSGDLIKVKVEDREIKGVVNKHLTLYLKDNQRKELYIMSTSFRIDSRSLINGIINLSTFDNVEIGIYQNKKGYSAYSLKQNGVRVDWKYELEELPRPKSVEFKGKTMNDYGIVDDFYANELKQLSERLSGKSVEPVKPEVAAKVAEVTKDTVDEDVPF